MADVLGGELPTKYQKDTTDLAKSKRKRTVRAETLGKAHDRMKEKARKGEPWCWRCYKRAFEKKQEEEYPRQKHDLTDLRDTKVKLGFAEYDDKKRYATLRDNTIQKKRIIDGQAVYLEYHYYRFQCTVCGGQMDIQKEKDKTPKQDA